MRRLRIASPFGCLAALLAVVLSPLPVTAQQAPAPPVTATVRVTQSTVVMERPRGDSIRVANVQTGDMLEVSDQQDGWYLVSPVTPPAGKPTWERGWIQGRFTEVVSGTIARPAGRADADAPKRPRGPLRVRAFGQFGGTLFDASDSFDALLGSPFGPVSGGGAQVVFPNFAYVEVSFERFRESGTRALVSGTQIFTLDSPTTLTVQPIIGTVGYRAADYGRLTPYLGVGMGWHILKEDSPGAPAENHGKLGYHIVGGTEFAIGRWVALGGEVQWAAVPKALGESGVSAFYEEDDLGGTTFRFKLIVGR